MNTVPNSALSTDTDGILELLFIYLFCSTDPTACGHHPTGYRICQKLYSIKYRKITRNKVRQKWRINNQNIYTLKYITSSV
jgi:hypothetical protein